MVAKFAMIVMFAGACLAFPAEDESSPVVGAPVGPPQPLSEPPAGPGAPLPAGLEPPQGPVPADAKPESDLKTDSSFWYRRSYYPVYYARSYYRPRTYSYYSYPAFYSSWNSWW